MSDGFIIKVAQSEIELKEVFEVRRKVFVEEQGVSKEEEYDEYETTSTHLILISDDQVLGTCRCRNTEKGVKLERFAVLEKYRGLGVGSLLVRDMLQKVNTASYVYLHAQVQVIDFYAKFGFVKEGEIFEEAGIQHYKMILKK